jgi:hypothetical protein
MSRTRAALVQHRRPALLALAIPLLLGLPGAARAEGLECRGRLVSEGDSKVDLLGKCGEPTRRDQREEERATLLFDPTSQTSVEKRVRVVVEQWTYDQGSNRFVRFVTLENGKVRRVETGGYGSAGARSERPAAPPLASCSSLSAFNLGDRASAVEARCGEPASRDTKVVDRRVSSVDQSGLVFGDATTLTVETWVYNFGPDSFLRLLKFVDGRLVKVETGGYGYR